MEESILLLLSSIGFEFAGVSKTEYSSVSSYKYYPEYLQDKHYVLFITKNNNNNSSLYNNHRLYTYDNSNVLYKDLIYLVYQSNTSYYNFLMKRINEVFAAEIRTITIKEIIND